MRPHNVSHTTPPPFFLLKSSTSEVNKHTKSELKSAEAIRKDRKIKERRLNHLKSKGASAKKESSGDDKNDRHKKNVRSKPQFKGHLKKKGGGTFKKGKGRK